MTWLEEHVCNVETHKSYTHLVTPFSLLRPPLVFKDRL